MKNFLKTIYKVCGEEEIRLGPIQYEKKIYE